MFTTVVATKNEEKNIERILKSLVAQKGVEQEIIVVDNGSNDATREIAKKFTDQVYDLSQEPDLTDIKNYRGAQVNFGVEKGKGEIIFFPDADMTFEDGLLKEAAEKISQENLDALYIPEIVLSKGLFGKIRNFERSFYNGTSIDAVRIVRREVFLKAGGFDTKNIVFGPDDWDLTKTIIKMAGKTGMTSRVLYHHENFNSVKEYLNKKANYSTSFDTYITKWGKHEKDIKEQFGFLYRFIGVFVEDKKWKKILTHPLLFSGVYFLKLAVGINYILYKIRKNREVEKIL